MKLELAIMLNVNLVKPETSKVAPPTPKLIKAKVIAPPKLIEAKVIAPPKAKVKAKVKENAS